MKKTVFNMPNAVTINGRSSSITNSFFNGIVPVIVPTDMQIKKALEVLEQDEDNVCCAYCGDKKTEWDHLYPLINNKKHTGYITEIANLVPACGKCNQSKGNSNWKDWMLGDAEKSPKTRGIPDLDRRIKLIENYDNQFKKQKINLEEIIGKELWKKYMEAYDTIISEMNKAQEMMNEIKVKLKGGKSWSSKKSITNNRTVVLNSSSTEKILYNYISYLKNRYYSSNTVQQYKSAILNIRNIEGMDFENFVSSIDRIVCDYDIGGKKEAYGNKGHKTWINALKRFQEYCKIM